MSQHPKKSGMSKNISTFWGDRRKKVILSKEEYLAEIQRVQKRAAQRKRLLTARVLKART